METWAIECKCILAAFGLYDGQIIGGIKTYRDWDNGEGSYVNYYIPRLTWDLGDLTGAEVMPISEGDFLKHFEILSESYI